MITISQLNTHHLTSVTVFLMMRILKIYSLACLLSCFCHVRLFASLWAVATRLLAMGFSRQEYRRGLPFPSPGIFLPQGSNARLLCLQHWQTGSLPLEPPGKSLSNFQIYKTVLLTIVTMIYIISQALHISYLEVCINTFRPPSPILHAPYLLPPVCWQPPIYSVSWFSVGLYRFTHK